MHMIDLCVHESSKNGSYDRSGFFVLTAGLCVVFDFGSMSTSEDPWKWTLNLLKAYCERHGLKKSGKKADVQQRYVYFFSSFRGASPAYKGYFLFTSARVLVHLHSSEETSTSQVQNKDDGSPFATDAQAVNGTPSGGRSAEIMIPEAALTPEEGRFPLDGWKSLVSGRLSAAMFSMQTMCTYFLDTVVSDGQQMKNFKAISATDSKSLRLFQRGFVKKIEVVAKDGLVFYRARCEPEMKSTSAYKLKMAVRTADTDEGAVVEKVVFAECMPCPAGKAPRASCKHLAALMFALEEFSRLGYTRDPMTCTDVLQRWNKPHQKKSEPCLASELDWSRAGKTKRKKRTADDMSDPRAVGDRGKAAEAAKEVARHCAPSTCGFAMVVGIGEDSQRKVQSDRQELADALRVPWQHLEVFDISDDEVAEVTLQQPVSNVQATSITERLSPEEWFRRNVMLDAEGAQELRKATSEQASCKAWFDARTVRVTASRVKQIISLRSSTNPANLVARMTSPAMFSNEATEYGRANEAVAMNSYQKLMSHMSGEDIFIEPCGLVVHPEFSWLGASPDGYIPGSNGLVEVKCPYTCRQSSFEATAAEKKSRFCLKQTPNGLRLHRSHDYYFQIATQLFVTKAAYCDLVVWSPTQLHIERIFPDPDFVRHVDKLKDFYFQHMLPHLHSARPSGL